MLAPRASAVLLAAALLAACSPDGDASSELRPGDLFAAVGAARGLPPPDADWPEGAYFMPEIMQGGVGLFEADGDGDLDLVQIRVPPPGSIPATITNTLWRQEADGSFTDIGRAAGLVEAGFGQGLAIGDTDNDGDSDL